MGKPIAVPTEGIKQLIQDAYQMCEPYQWAREAVANSIEAGASWILVGVDRQGLEATGVARRYIADNGHGMNSEKLEVFLSMFGGGGKTIGFDANRGVGLKASSYTWNQYGVVVISWTEDNPDGALVWIRQNDDGIWEQRDFSILDDTDEVVDIATIIEPGWDDELQIDFAKFRTVEIERAGHGTVVLFLGDGPTRNTDLGDYTRTEVGITGIAKYLNSRFLTVPDGVTIKVEAVEAHDRAEGDEGKERASLLPEGTSYPVPVKGGKVEQRTKVYLHPRIIKGLREFIPTSNPVKFPDAQSGVVAIPYRGCMVEVEWFYQPKVAKGSTDGTRVAVNGAEAYGPGPRIVYRYDQDTKYGRLSEAYVTHTHYQVYSRYGFRDLRDGLYLIVHLPEWDNRDPNKWGVMPQQSRAALVGAGGVPNFEVIVEEVADLFYARAAELKTIVSAELAKRDIDTNDLAKTLKRTIGRLADRMRPTKVFADPAGSVTGTAAGSTNAGPNSRGGSTGRKLSATSGKRVGARRVGTGASKQKTQIEPNSTGSATGSKQRQSDGLPTVEWNAEPFNAAGMPHLAVMFELHGDPLNGAGLVTLNPLFPMFLAEFKYWEERWPKFGLAAVSDLVKEVYAAEAVSKVTHITKMKTQDFKDGAGRAYKFGEAPEYKDMLSAATLTAAVMGLVNVDQHIVTRGGGRFGKAVAEAVAV